jgi:hypothetical protein
VVSTGLLVNSMSAEENWEAIEHQNGKDEVDEEDKKEEEYVPEEDEEYVPEEDEDWVDEEEEEEEEEEEGEDWEYEEEEDEAPTTKRAPKTKGGSLVLSDAKRKRVSNKVRFVTHPAHFAHPANSDYLAHPVHYADLAHHLISCAPRTPLALLTLHRRRRRRRRTARRQRKRRRRLQRPKCSMTGERKL